MLQTLRTAPGTLFLKPLDRPALLQTLILAICPVRARLLPEVRAYPGGRGIIVACKAVCFFHHLHDCGDANGLTEAVHTSPHLHRRQPPLIKQSTGKCKYLGQSISQMNN